jgi:hypothetical protein
MRCKLPVACMYFVDLQVSRLARPAEPRSEGSSERHGENALVPWEDGQYDICVREIGVEVRERAERLSPDKSLIHNVPELGPDVALAEKVAAAVKKLDLVISAASEMLCRDERHFCRNRREGAIRPGCGTSHEAPYKVDETPRRQVLERYGRGELNHGPLHQVLHMQDP